MPSGVYVRTEEHKQRLKNQVKSLNLGFKKGHKINLGREWTDEAREKLRQANLDKVISIDNLEKLRQANLGNTYNLGRHPSDATKLKMSLVHKGNKTNLGHKHSDATKLKMSLVRMGRSITEGTKEKIRQSHLGAKSWRWKGGISIDNVLIRKSGEYYQWRKVVFKRDRWTCQECGYKGSLLDAHHIKRFSKYIGLRLEISNGITLCKDCHKQIHKRKVLIA